MKFVDGRKRRRIKKMLNPKMKNKKNEKILCVVESFGVLVLILIKTEMMLMMLLALGKEKKKKEKETATVKGALKMQHVCFMFHKRKRCK